MKTVFAIPFGIFAVVFTCGVAGCVGPADDAANGSAGGSLDVGDVTNVVASEVEAEPSVLGAYEASFPATGQPELRVVVFTRESSGNGRAFFAEVDTGIRCVTEPCPSTARIDGWFTAGASAITLHVTQVTATPGSAAQSQVELEGLDVLAGAYTYRISSGGRLRLTRDGVIRTFKSVGTYCRADEDCIHQAYIRPRCVGYSICRADLRCSYKCGKP